MTYIYLISNINNESLRSYVGKTKNPIRREYHHKRRFGNQIQFKIIDQIESINSAEWKPLEIKWIRYYEQLGYTLENKNEGGNGPDKHSNETKFKISKSKQGNTYNLGKKYSDESKNKIKIKKQGQKYNVTKKGKEHGNYGVIRSNEWKEKQSISKKGKKIYWAYKITQGKIGKGLKPIIQLDKENNLIKEWSSLKEASQILGIKSGDISKVCSEKQNTAGGFKWKYKVE
jgi:hypothetical protein